MFEVYELFLQSNFTSILANMGHFNLFHVKMLIEAFALAVKSSLIVKRIIGNKHNRIY